MAEIAIIFSVVAGTTTAISAGVWYGTRYMEQAQDGTSRDRPIVLPPPKLTTESQPSV